MAKIYIENSEDFKKNFILPEEYKRYVSVDDIKRDLERAKKILKKYKDGKFYITNNLYEWFVFEIPNKVRILFYPHKTISTQNVNTRARNQNSANIDLFDEIKLFLESPKFDGNTRGCRGFYFKEDYKKYMNKNED